MTGRRPRRRVDLLLVDRGLAPSRSRAHALLLAGRVRSEGRRVDKPGALINEDAPLEVTPGPRYVSRGGLKLVAALRELGVDPHGRHALDVGASTGGFTQVLLEMGASRVAALDVGRGQLDWSLRNDPRVVVMEGINARYLERSHLPFRPSLAVIDVSFISVEKVLPAVMAVLEDRGETVALAKPQFEVGRGKVGRGGIVRDPALHQEVLESTTQFALDNGWAVRGLARSVVRGAEGNVEFFLHLALSGPGLDGPDLSRAISKALDLTRRRP